MGSILKEIKRNDVSCAFSLVFIGHWTNIYASLVNVKKYKTQGAQWLSGRVLDSRPRDRGFEPHRRHCVVVLEQDTFILA